MPACNVFAKEFVKQMSNGATVSTAVARAQSAVMDNIGRNDITLGGYWGLSGGNCVISGNDSYTIN